ncbi:hypothetical protein I5G86_gp22 [Mycobacterium phage DarthP]|uniref:Uncharacterized protein n=2 Tax=Amginevirus TaxID=2946794 RepID=A0A222ZNS2_9CAUD|nr:hypothetical protein I5G85_gp22 [Mycobacterium phage Amohnition]YP_009952035.1 hypothetical protein I5G86_gp22 [Mycobacterium phage DarthP]ASR86357.1 hypothetical protein SEA_AMOHNITION_77 [Mycobacterium phage Amohnition]ASW31823.1 hypothetical protein SEA_DARTHP_77 [Mycobacterium phage DarthP]
MTALSTGLSCNVFRSSLGDCTNKGATSVATSVTLVGYIAPGESTITELPRMDRPHAVSDASPAVVMVESNLRGALPHLVPLDVVRAGRRPMMGGNHAGGDSRFGKLIERVYGGPKCVSLLPVHDRIES